MILMSDSIPSSIVKFLDTQGSVIENAALLYPDMVSALPEGTDAPSMNEWLYYYNMFQTQKLCDFTLKCRDAQIMELTELQSQANPDLDRVRFLIKSVKTLEDRYANLSKTIIKYANDGINREKPKKIIHERAADPIMIGKALRSAKRVIDLD